jgi:hypothetical protein
MSNPAPTAAATKPEYKEKESPAAPPKAEKAEPDPKSKPKPKGNGASETDSSDDSDDSDDEKDPGKKEKKKAKKAEKAKNASAKDHAGGKPKKDTGSFVHTQSLMRQEQRHLLTSSSRKAPSQETRLKQAC